MSWADVSDEFTIFVEHALMPFCEENTEWETCDRYGIEYDCKVKETDQYGCSGTICCCKPFGEGDFTYGIAEELEFNL